jgi:hypothetical protein
MWKTPRCLMTCSSTRTELQGVSLRLIRVSMESKPDSNGAALDFHHSREAYDDAFHRLSVAVHEHAEVTDAQREYHERRDSLAQLIMNADRLRQRRLAVERLAYSLWEQAGHPSGTAESDWYRAEALFRRIAKPNEAGARRNHTG